MTGDTHIFEKLRLDAAHKFAQTMIVIDDEASQEPEAPTSQPVGALRRPDRRTRPATIAASAPTTQNEVTSLGKHALDAKSLIDKAMDLGLICSVLRPKKGENFRRRVVGVAQVADIVCLDWEIYDDGGDDASRIIRDIIRKDAKQNGRLRLIAIYTGDVTNNVILDKVFDAIPNKIRNEHGYKKGPLKIESKNGVKIVCLFKTHGVRLSAPRKANQVSESQLPKRLQSEFATLSEGLLSNVALATIASIRSSTHHVLSKFSGQMDGPFFHHRALIESPDDAEEYAVDIVLSELKGAIDKRQVAARQAGTQAIEARIREIAGSAETLTLCGSKTEDSHSLGLETIVKIVTDGLDCGLKQAPNPPKKNMAKENFSSLFSKSQQTARDLMHQFAAITGVRAHPGSYLYQSDQSVPRLGLGTIIQEQGGTYLLCLQASCDSVRIEEKGNFLFVPLDEEDSKKKDFKPEHVVPISSGANQIKYVGLSTSEKSYRVVRSIEFSACQETKTVNARRIRYRSSFHFKDTDGKSYRWIADLKRRRALRTVQRLGQNMGRLGFDEFEPYRR